MYSKRNASFGLNTNVSLDPSANSKADAKSNQSINNNIVIQTSSTENKKTEDNIDNNTIRERTVYPTTEPYTSPFYPSILTVQERSADVTTTTTSVQSILLEIYESILLTQNKQLLANILSKNSIIISKSDLERVIQAKLDLICNITTETSTGLCGCCAKVTGINKVDQIIITTNDGSSLDFKTAYNSVYNELKNTYKLSLKYVID